MSTMEAIFRIWIAIHGSIEMPICHKARMVWRLLPRPSCTMNRSKSIPKKWFILQKPIHKDSPSMRCLMLLQLITCTKNTSTVLSSLSQPSSLCTPTKSSEKVVELSAKTYWWSKPSIEASFSPIKKWNNLKNTIRAAFLIPKHTPVVKSSAWELESTEQIFQLISRLTPKPLMIWYKTSMKSSSFHWKSKCPTFPLMISQIIKKSFKISKSHSKNSETSKILTSMKQNP